MVRPCRLVDALIAIPEMKIYDFGSNTLPCMGSTAESSFRKIANGIQSKMAHQSPSGMMVSAGLKQ